MVREPNLYLGQQSITRKSFPERPFKKAARFFVYVFEQLIIAGRISISSRIKIQIKTEKIEYKYSKSCKQQIKSMKIVEFSFATILYTYI